MKNVYVLGNKQVEASLDFLRDRSADITVFRKHSDIVAGALIKFSVSDINDSSYVVIISILRSALALLPDAIKSLPSAGVGFAGLRRDEKTAKPDEYYWKMPAIKGKIVLIPDPMLATGGSILHVLRKIKEQNPKEIRIISIVCAPEGIEAIQKEFPNTKIYTIAVDKGLDSKKFIVPGLGDFGDRYFGTYSPFQPPIS